jgi:hypothetical protein
MHGQRIGADDQEGRLVIDESDQHVAKVFVQLGSPESDSAGWITRSGVLARG